MLSSDYYRGKEQTYLKHYFLEKYLEAVVYHIGYANREFVYVDCFSGPWRNDHDQFADTSIAIALKGLNNARQGLAAKGKDASIRAIFVEKDPAAFAALQQALDLHRGTISTTAFHGTFEEKIPNIIQAVGPKCFELFLDRRALVDNGQNSKARKRGRWDRHQ